MSNLASVSRHGTPHEQRSVYTNALLPMLWLAASVALALGAIRGGIFNSMSTDDAMRLVEVRDLIHGQNWFDLSQHRLNPPGTLMHWSHLVDLPLAASILALRPWLGMHGAEAATLLLWPTLLLAAVLALVLLESPGK